MHTDDGFKRQRPTTAATSFGGPNRLAKSGTRKGLKSNSILKINMLSRSTVRQQTFNTNDHYAKQMATRDSCGLSSDRSPSMNPVVQPRLP